MSSPQFILRKINNQHILVPYTFSSNVDYIILNNTAVKIYKLFFIEKLCIDDIVLNLKKIYSSINISILKDDVILIIENINRINKINESNPHSNNSEIINFSIQRKIFEKSLADSKIISMVMLELTYHCNLKCLHCYCTHCTFTQKELTTKEIFDILEQIVESGCLRLVLTGGEAFLRKDFEDIYIYAKKLGLIITIFSNAILINKRLIEIFIKYPPKIIEISVYGASNETYFKLTKDSRGFDKLINSLNLLDSYKIKYSIKTFVTQQNKNDFSKIKELALSRNVEFRHDEKVINQINGIPIPSAIALTHFEVFQIENQEYIIDNKFILSNEDKKNSFNNNKLFYCAAGRTSCLINSFGDVSLCTRIRDVNYNIKNNKFQLIWSLLNKKSEMTTSDNFNCNLCDAFDYCSVCPSVDFMSNSEKHNEFCSFAYMRKLTNEQNLNF